MHYIQLLYAMKYIVQLILFSPFGLFAQISCDSIDTKYTGVCCEFDDTIVTSKIWYKKGEPTGRVETFHKNGHNRLIRNKYSNTSLTVSSLLYSRKGSLIEERKIKNGTGRITKYYSNGALRFKAEFKDSLPIGNWIIYDLEGTVFHQQDANQLIKVKSYSFDNLNSTINNNEWILKLRQKGDISGEIIIDSLSYKQVPPNYLTTNNWKKEFRGTCWKNNYNDQILLLDTTENNILIGLIKNLKLQYAEPIDLYLYIGPATGLVVMNNSDEELPGAPVYGWYIMNEEWIKFNQISRSTIYFNKDLIVMGGQWHRCDCKLKE